MHPGCPLTASPRRVKIVGRYLPTSLLSINPDTAKCSTYTISASTNSTSRRAGKYQSRDKSKTSPRKHCIDSPLSRCLRSHPHNSPTSAAQWPSQPRRSRPGTPLRVCAGLGRRRRRRRRPRSAQPRAHHGRRDAAPGSSSWRAGPPPTWRPWPAPPQPCTRRASTAPCVPRRTPGPGWGASCMSPAWRSSRRGWPSSRARRGRGRVLPVAPLGVQSVAPGVVSRVLWPSSRLR